VYRIGYGPCSGTKHFGSKICTDLCIGCAQELAVLVARSEQNLVRAVLRN